MAPQVASLSELSRIRGDAEVRYPNAETEPRLYPPRRETETKRRQDRGGRGRTAENSLLIFVFQQWKESEWERDMRGKRGAGPQ